MRMTMLLGVGSMVAACLAGGCGRRGGSTRETARPQGSLTYEVTRTDRQWREQLTPEQYRVTRQRGTERAYTGKYWHTTTEGVYRCVCCGQALFDSSAKFDSHTGWPSFYEPIASGRVGELIDDSWAMRRTEIVCRRCGAHLGHVFDDGPAPTGLRYCVNSASLVLSPRPSPQPSATPKP